jgi:hypothetical protein
MRSTDPKTEEFTGPKEWFWKCLYRERHHLKGAPVAFVLVLLLGLAGGWLFAWKVVVASKDATIQTWETSDRVKQSRLDQIQKDNDAFAKQISELKSTASHNTASTQSLLDDLYSNMTFEPIATTNTDRFVYDVLTNGHYQAFLKLKYAPIPNSLQGFITGENLIPGPIDTPVAHIRNVATVFLWGEWKFTNVVFAVQYVRDTRETNLFQKVEIRQGDLLLDGKRFERPLEPR